ncbi:MAG: tetratricopeptide repeat protein [Acidobacteriota bacterium]
MNDRTAARTERIKELFAAAMPLDPAGRIAALDRACAGDQQFRQAVASLLDNYDSAQQFFAQFPDNFARQFLGLTAGPPTFATGALIGGRFRIIGFLGAGGMGEVYEAEDLFLASEHVALKTLPADVSDDSHAIDRLKRELALARQVTHVNVCRVFDVDQHVSSSGRPLAFFTMELLAGETLRARLQREGPLSTTVALPLVRQMAAALTAAHTAGVVHGDFKPGNVVLVPSTPAAERLVVTDFGLARRDAAPDSVSNGGAGWGTPGYMAPEQLAGGGPTRASDVYALAAVAFETVTGKPPSGTATVDAISIDPSWRSALLGGLDANPKTRVASVDALLRALTAVPPTANPHWRRAAAVAVLSLIFFGVLLLPPVRARLWPTIGGDGAAVAGRRQNVAVLAFEAADRTPAAAAYARGLAATLTDQLSTVTRDEPRHLFVPAAALLATGVNTPVRANRALGADVAITGRVDRAPTDRPGGGEPGSRRVTIEVHEVSAPQSVVTPGRHVDLVEGKLVLPLVSNEVARMLAMRPTIAVAGNTAPSPAVEERYIRGRGYLEQGRAPRIDVAQLELAVAEFEGAIEGDRRFAAAHAALGETFVLLYEATKDTRRNTELLDLAEQRAIEACRLEPKIAHFFVVRALAYLANGRHSLAIPSLEAALRLDPDAVGARDNLARAYAATAQAARAEQMLEQGVNDRPRSWSAHEDLGVLRLNRGQYRIAEIHFLKGREYAPDNPRVISNLAVLYTMTELFDAAEQELQRGLALTPDPILYNNLGWAYFYQGRFADGVASLKHAADLSTENSVVLAGLARGYRWVNRQREARAAYAVAISAAKRQLSADPSNAEVLANLAYLYSETGEQGEARRLIGRALQAAPENVRVKFTSALVFELSSQRQAALQALQSAIDGGHPKYQIAHHPDLRALRTDSRYVQLIAAAAWTR